MITVSTRLPATTCTLGSRDSSLDVGAHDRCSARPRAILPGELNKLSVVTWNAVGLLAVEADIARKKMRYSRRLSFGHDITCVQQTHGDSTQLKWLRLDFGRTQFVECSTGARQPLGAALPS